MITVSEGFDDAWEPAANLGGTTITIATLNLPAGVELRFPATVEFRNPADENDDHWATLTLSGDDRAEVTVGETVDDNDNDGSVVTYDYSIESAGTDEVGDVMDSFAIPITIVTGDIASGAGGIADIWAILSPEPSDDDANIGMVLSYVKVPVTDPESDDGDFLNIADCVTYLLFPYITCGAHTDWDTGIAIANTTMDDGIFGLSAGATAQRGSVIMYAFPTGEKTVDDYSTAMGYMGEPTMAMLSGGLAAGDSLAMTCSSNEMLAGMQGYAIVKAGFRHAHGMAFVTNSASGAVDAVHGYVALVIPDPEFGGMNEDRAAAEGEVLGALSPGLPVDSTGQPLRRLPFFCRRPPKKEAIGKGGRGNVRDGFTEAVEKLAAAYNPGLGAGRRFLGLVGARSRRPGPAQAAGQRLPGGHSRRPGRPGRPIRPARFQGDG